MSVGTLWCLWERFCVCGKASGASRGIDKKPEGDREREKIEEWGSREREREKERDENRQNIMWE